MSFEYTLLSLSVQPLSYQTENTYQQVTLTLSILPTNTAVADKK